jgi:hypothetical protein
LRHEEGKMKAVILAASLAIMNVGALVAESAPRVALEAPHQHKAKLVRLLKQQFPDADAVTALVRNNKLYLSVWKGGQAQVATLPLDGSLRSRLAHLTNTKEVETKIGSVGPTQIVLREPDSCAAGWFECMKPSQRVPIGNSEDILQ